MVDPLASLLIVIGVIVAAIAVIGTVSNGGAYKEIGRRALAVGLDQEEIDAARAAILDRDPAQDQDGLSASEGRTEDRTHACDLAMLDEGRPLADERTSELRQLLRARNEGRARRGEEPLDLEHELQRLLAASAELPVAPEDRV
jgi:hypothetical protein